MCCDVSLALNFLREHPPMRLALVLSVLAHALLLSLSFGGDGFGLPGLTLPWQQKRFHADDLHVVQLLHTPRAALPAEVLPQPDSAPVPVPVPANVTEPAAVLTPAPLSESATASVLTPATANVAPSTAPTTALAEPPTIAAQTPPAPTLTARSPPEVNARVVPAPPKGPIPVLTAAPNTPPAQPVIAPRGSGDDAPNTVEPETQDAAREAAKLEATKLETARLDAQRQLETQQTLTRQEAARVQAQQQAVARQEAERQQAARQATAQQEAQRAEAARIEAQRQESAKIEAAKLEAAKLETARLEAQRQLEAQQALARKEAARVQAQQQAAARQEAERQQAAARLEAQRQDATRQDPAKLEKAQKDAERAAYEAKREERLRAIGQQLNEEAAKRDAAAQAANATPPPSSLPTAYNTPRRGRLFGRTDTNADLVRYAQTWSRKIELNLNFDQVREAVKQRHATPMVTVAVRSDGSVESVTFVVSSGVAEIDDGIRRIVQSQAPFPAFPPALAREYDVVEIRRSWQFDMAIRLY